MFKTGFSIGWAKCCWFGTGLEVTGGVVGGKIDSERLVVGVLEATNM